MMMLTKAAQKSPTFHINYLKRPAVRMVTKRFISKRPARPRAPSPKVVLDAKTKLSRIPTAAEGEHLGPDVDKLYVPIHAGPLVRLHLAVCGQYSPQAGLRTPVKRCRRGAMVLGFVGAVAVRPEEFAHRGPYHQQGSAGALHESQEVVEGIAVASQAVQPLPAAKHERRRQDPRGDLPHLRLGEQERTDLVAVLTLRFLRHNDDFGEVFVVVVVIGELHGDCHAVARKSLLGMRYSHFSLAPPAGATVIVRCVERIIGIDASAPRNAVLLIS
mmetsp:Transcript_42956/g.130716  ORF Transcript_42956/g.130716 Transcript_42956/m.130716 type:complete len:273 (+) Transcript_42956:116-934(+)